LIRCRRTRLIVEEEEASRTAWAPGSNTEWEMRSE
jgi:hypothetical protein